MPDERLTPVYPLRTPETSSIAVTAGHWTDVEARTGCTVVLFDRSAMAVVDIRGGAPGTRETDLLAPGRLVRRVNAVLLTGGSAFGLAAADGVMRFLAERGRGVATRTGPMPIVSAAVIYDLAVGRPISPDAEAGRQACHHAGPLDELARGEIGVGAGATTGKLGGVAESARGGLGVGSWSWSAGSVTVVAVVNSFGDVFDVGTGRPRFAEHVSGDRRPGLVSRGDTDIRHGESTTIAVALVDAPVDHSTLTLCTIAAHDAFARSVRPCHTIFDGDVAFAVALREGAVSPSDALSIAVATELATERAIADAVSASPH